MNKKKKNQIQTIILLVCILLFLICGGWLLIDAINKNTGEKDAEELKNNFVTVEQLPVVTEEPKPEPTDAPKETEDLADATSSPYDAPVENEDVDAMARQIDFAGLQKEENADIYAWIYIPGTNVDYPILQHPADPGYYLRRNTKGKSATAGCIFTELYNSKDFNDNVTVIYGHNMRNESMFAHLHKYEDEAFFDENPYIYIYTESEIRIYQVFAAHKYNDSHLLLNGDMGNQEYFQGYLDGLRNLNGKTDHFNWDIGVTGEDKIITLSTCVRNEDDKRYLVQAKLISIQ